MKKKFLQKVAYAELYGTKEFCGRIARRHFFKKKKKIHCYLAEFIGLLAKDRHWCIIIMPVTLSTIEYFPFKLMKLYISV